MKMHIQTSSLQNQLAKLKIEITRKLEVMVEVFTYNIVHEAIERTPFGDARAYAKFYNDPRRKQLAGNASAGSAKGGWVITQNKPWSSTWFMQAQDENAQNVKSANDSRSENYKLGDTVFISNNVPYMVKTGWPYGDFGSIEGGYSSQAPMGVVKPTMNQIKTVFSLDLANYYKRA